MGADDSGPLKGVFSTSEQGWVGFGATKKKVDRDVYYYAEAVGDDVRIQPLSDAFVPSGDSRLISHAELLENFMPEPNVYTGKMLPAVEELDGALLRGDNSRANGELFSAEYEYKCALRMDEANIRATFGLGLTYLDRAEKDRAVLVFRRLVKLRDAFEPKHKHLFNEFGISLRKSGMLTEALKYYSRAHQLGRDDEHLLYNMARTHFDKGNMRSAYGFLQKALVLNPSFKPAKGFVAYMENQGLESMDNLEAPARGDDTGSFESFSLDDFDLDI